MGICYLPWGADRAGGVVLELRASFPSTGHRHHRCLRRHHPHWQPPAQGAQERRLHGRRLPHQSPLSGVARAQVLSRRHVGPRALRAGGGGGARTGCRAGHPRLRQGRHPLRCRAHRRFSRVGTRGAQARGGAQARAGGDGGAHRRAQLPGHAVGRGAGVGRVRQRLGRDGAEGRQRVVRLPVRRLRLCHRQPRRGAGRGLSLLRLLRQRGRHHHPRAALGLSRRPRHVAGLRVSRGHARCAPPPRSRRQVAADRQARADLEGGDNRCRHQGRGLAHRQHDRQLRPLSRGHAPVRLDRGRRRRADRRHRQAVRARARAGRLDDRRAVDLGRLRRGVCRCRRARRADLAAVCPADAGQDARAGARVRLAGEPRRHHRRRVLGCHAVQPHARGRPGGPGARSAGDPARFDFRPARRPQRRDDRRGRRQDQQARAFGLVGPARQVGEGRQGPRGGRRAVRHDARAPGAGGRGAGPLRCRPPPPAAAHRHRACPSRQP